MTIGNVIRTYRKELGLTQEEMAKRLGVTTPAVNKWENNNSMPDITLLAPIARLLHITTDTLLSFREDLTDEEIALFIEDLNQKLEKEPYTAVFSFAKEKAEEYPNCGILLWSIAVVLESWKISHPFSDDEVYNDQIRRWYLHALESEDRTIKAKAARSLYHFYMRKKDFEQAENCLAQLPEDDADRKIKQALLYSETGRTQDAFQIYEGLLLSEFNRLRMVLNNLHILYMQEKDYDMARKLIGIESSLAKLFEMGRYQEASPGLELAVAEKNVEETERIMRILLEHSKTLTDFTRSGLYRHTPFKKTPSAFSDQLKKNLLEGFLTEETFSYMHGNPYWEKLKNNP